ncbi:MAG TPA: PA2928 family protein [Chitinophaga sp.]|uniref:PA2928 family protein n=1 Tax=Chitinophaga sp. TaxID=1869181 RepID=UPI002DC016EB|nr:PA2928 family protein [Chitinophaga sp.]HEU4552229.1 PA2928 family protein [Chitinophaga sp.]
MIRHYLFPVILLFLTSGCFFKSDKTGAADGIICEYLYTDSAGQVLIAHEKVFHATSKSTGNGFTRISGFTNTRLSAYDVKDGHLLVRIVFGGESDDACMLLGLTGNQLWCIRKNGQVAIQTIDPRTLQVKATADQLLRQASFLEEHLANPEWYQLPQFFGYDVGRGVILSDDQGFRYALNPATLQVTKLTDVNYQLPPLQDGGITGQRAIYNDSVVLRLEGNPRNHLVTEPGSRSPENDPGFLKGSFLIDRNISRLQQMQTGQLQEVRSLINQQKSMVDSLQSLADSLRRNKTGANIRSMENTIRDMQNRIDDLVRKAGRITPNRRGNTDRLLQTAPDNFFILQASNTNKDAGLRLSLVQWAPGQPLRIHWQNNLTGLFFDASNARETNAFKEVFSGGNPEFTFRWADITQQKLLLTWMLHTTCIDVPTGKVVWQIKH